MAATGQNRTELGEFVQELLLGSGGLIIVKAALAVTEALKDFTLPGGQEELAAGLLQLLLRPGRLASRLGATLIEQGAVEATLLELGGPESRRKAGAPQLVVSGDCSLGGAQAASGLVEPKEGPSAKLLGGPLGLLPQGQYHLESETKGLHSGLTAAAALGFGIGARALSSNDQLCSRVKASATSWRRNWRSGSCLAMAWSMAGLLPAG